MKPYQIRTAFHTLLAGLAIIEIKQAKTPFRRAVCAAWGAFHAASAIEDFIHREETLSNTESAR